MEPAGGFNRISLVTQFKIEGFANEGAGIARTADDLTGSNRAPHFGDNFIQVTIQRMVITAVANDDQVAVTFELVGV